MKSRFEEERLFFAEKFQCKIEEVPNYKIKTPLQRAIQILKRHRDIMFERDPDNKPISIIITTLAGHAYNNESDILETLVNVAHKMSDHIDIKSGGPWIGNPVNPEENFADKWKSRPQLEKSFYRWIKQLQADLHLASKDQSIEEFSEVIGPIIGENIVQKAMDKIRSSSENDVSPTKELKNSETTIFKVKHRQALPWPSQINYSVNLTGCVVEANGRKVPFQSNGQRLPKHKSLFFDATTDARKPYTVFWQIVNTGKEAENAGCLRGKIFQAERAGAGGLTQKESTLYSGSHWIECFIVKDEICVARSGEYIVNIGDF